MSRLDHFIMTFKSAPKKIKDLLRRKRWNEALIFFFFIFLSFGFWMLQSLQQDYEIELSIPVRYTNVPPNIAFTTTPPNQIRVKIKDKGSVLLNYTLGRTIIPIEVPLKNTSTASSQFVVTKKEIERDIFKQLLSTTSLQNFEPQQIKLEYNPKKKKILPVVFNGVIETKAGYSVSDSIRINPASVEVYASEVLLDTLTCVRTEYTAFKQVKKPVVHHAKLEAIAGAVFVPQAVLVNISVEEYTEKVLDITIRCSDLPHDLTLRTFPSSARVTCNVPLSRFKKMTEADFSINIPFAKLELNMSGIVAIELTRKPDWVKNALLSPEKIEFVLEQNDLK